MGRSDRLVRRRGGDRRCAVLGVGFLTGLLGEGFFMLLRAGRLTARLTDRFALYQQAINA